MPRRFILSLAALSLVVWVVACSGPPQGGPPGDFGSQAPPIRTPTRVSANNTPAGTAVPATAVPTSRPSVLTPAPLPTVLAPTIAPAAALSTSGAQPTAAPAAQSQSGGQPQSIGTLAGAGASTVTLDSLRGKIIFFTDREGSSAQLYVMDTDGSNAHACDCSDVLQTMVKRDVTSPDQKLFLFLKSVGGSVRVTADTQIWTHNNQTNYEAVLTGEAPGFPGLDYAPAWSPDSRHIAWVSTTDGNDEIYIHDTVTNENRRLTENQDAWDKHPSFSPDGSRIVFWSNRDSAVKKQIWIMSIDGSAQQNVSHNSFNDYDPYWVK